MKLLGRALLIIGVLAVIGPFTQPLLQYTEIPDSPSGRTPGEQHAEFGFSLGSSIKGQSNAHDVRSVLQVFPVGANPDTAEPFRTYVDLPFEVTSNAEWEDFIEVPETETHSPMYLNLRFEALPEDVDLWGKPFRIVASGEVTYPDKLLMSPEEAGTNRGEFIDAIKPFEESVSVSFRDRAAHEKYQREWAAYEAASASEEQGLLRPLRDAMTYGFSPSLLKLLCWGVAAICSIAGWRLLIVSRRRHGAAPPQP